MMEALKYPIGHYQKPDKFDKGILSNYILSIASLPAKLRQEVEGLSEEQLNTPYRPGGWTVRQVVHHLADSHMNAFIRLKLALSEATPVIKPYPEALWAELADGKNLPIAPSFQIIEGVHLRWVTVLNSMEEGDWERGFIHPEKGRELKLNESTGSYAWHGEHHLAHITSLKKRMNW